MTRHQPENWAGFRHLLPRPEGCASPSLPGSSGSNKEHFQVHVHGTGGLVTQGISLLWVSGPLALDLLDLIQSLQLFPLIRADSQLAPRAGPKV